MADDDSTRLRLADLRNRTATHFEITPDADTRAQIGAELGIIGIKKLRFAGQIGPQGSRDWMLRADLGATVVQSCVITLDPVTTRLDEKVTRTYLAAYEDPDAGEIEMPEDDSVEALPEVVDLMVVLTEALALALPPFPRSAGAALGEVVHTEPGKDAMTDDDAKPFAGLGALRDALANKGKDDPT